MKRRSQADSKTVLSDAQTTAMQALASYQDVLAALAQSGRTHGKKNQKKAKLLFLDAVEGLDNLYLSLSTVAPAIPAAVDEEWNPLSQRPHAPLPPPVGGELGLEVSGLKEAVDAFTTLSHEMMHVALWEPFFTGKWHPRTKAAFRDFSLMAEGYCFYFSDIVVSGLVRVRFPDGEFALARQTPSNALFHPIRAFHALGITKQEEILDTYLKGFTGKETKLLQPRGTSNFTEALAARIYEFYSGTIGYLDQMHHALSTIGCLDEFYTRYCDIPGLPSFLDGSAVAIPNGPDFRPYFKSFHERAHQNLARLDPAQVKSVRWRRMLQSRAYYALQVRWILSEGLFMATGWSVTRSRQLLGWVESYLESLQGLLQLLAGDPDVSLERRLTAIDKEYDRNIRQAFAAHDVWAGHRWLIVPTRAGGLVSIFSGKKLTGRAAKVKILRIVAFLIDELTRAMKASQTVEQRAAMLAEIQRIAAIGAVCGHGRSQDVTRADRALHAVLKRPLVRVVWSLPLTAFDPLHNRFREFAFSYQ